MEPTGIYVKPYLLHQIHLVRWSGSIFQHSQETSGNFILEVEWEPYQTADEELIMSSLSSILNVHFSKSAL